MDASGNVYVADSYNNRIQKFTSDGTYITQWGSFGTGSGQFSMPYGITVDTSGNVFVTDSLNNRVQKFSAGDPSADNAAKCYIATAAYGSYLDPHVWVLRDFRDRYLAPYSAGRILLDLYYKYSSPIADYIRDRTELKWAVRIVITPLVFAIKYPLSAGFVLLIPSFLFLIQRRIKR